MREVDKDVVGEGGKRDGLPTKEGREGKTQRNK
jgi:hypothetical protein